MLSRLDSPRKQKYGADLAITRLNDDLRRIYELWGYDPITKTLNPNELDPFGPDPQRESFFKHDVEQRKKAIEYIENHYPKPKECEGAKNSDKEITTDNEYIKEVLYENEELKIKQTQFIDENNKLRKDLADLKTELEDLKQPLTELTTVQKVRMELAYQLLKAAGLTDDTLKKQNNKQKVATIMSVLLDIHNKNARGNDAQTCATYLSAAEPLPERHKPTVEQLNKLMSDLEIDIIL